MATAFIFLPLLRPCIMSELVSLSTIGHRAFLNRLAWYLPAVWGIGPDKQWGNAMIEKVVDAELDRRAHVTGERMLKAEDINIHALGKVDKEPSYYIFVNDDKIFDKAFQLVNGS
ncbi:ABC transporter ATP-binding protein [Striga asiatica]|uniref:ABC transporter ATP-binding protein n=1 Tax=Striga asiatica TaxID=4170 RepID=A0A5A7P4S4_STRAF|nr:ABC transporter ATP-binding protein [Striga asiatica]